MTQSEYDKAKQECKKDLRNKLMLGNLQGDLFSATFDRAYALGKVKDLISQDEIDKAAVIAAANYNNPFDEPAYDKRFYDGFKAGANFAIGKQEKDADTVIQGWVAVDEAYNECYLHTNKPTHENRPIADTGDYESYWRSKGQTYLLDADLFPDMDSDSDPIEVEIILKRKKK